MLRFLYLDNCVCCGVPLDKKIEYAYCDPCWEKFYDVMTRDVLSKK